MVSGLDEEQARGEGWAQAVHPEDRERVFGEWGRFVQERSNEFQSFHRFLRPDGAVSWTTVRSVPLRDGGYLGTVEDVTEFRRAEQDLRRRIDQLQTAYRMTDAVNRATALDDIYEEALESLQHALKADRASILLADDDGVMRFKAWRGLSDGYRAAVEGHSPWTPDTTAPEPILCSDVANDPSLAAFRDTVAAEGIAALGFIPLVSQGRLLGKMMIYYDQPYKFRREDVDLAQNMASHIAFALQRKRVQDQIQAQREQLEAIVTSVPGVVWEVSIDAEGPRPEFVSDHIVTMLGYAMEQVLAAEAWRRIVHPDDLARATQELAAVYASGQGGVTEFRCVAANGRTVWVEVRSTVLADPDGRPLGLRGVAMDITDRKQAEDAVRDHRTRLAGIISSAMDAIITIDEQQRVIVFNTAAEQMFRFPAERAIGQTIDRFIPERHRQAHAHHIRTFAQTGVSSRTMRSLGTVSGLRSNGEEFPIEATISQVDTGGQRMFTVIIRDITERVRAELRLSAQHAVTRILADSSSIEEAMPRVLQTVCETLAWDLGTFWTIDQSAQGLRCLNVWQGNAQTGTEFDQDSRQRVFSPGRGLPGRVWANGEPAWIADVTQDDTFARAPVAVRQGLRAAFAVPVTLGGKVLGVLEFFSGSIRQPDEDLLQMMAAIGSQIGQFVERRRAEERIKASLAEKEVLLKEIHHRVKNNMQVISSLLSLQADHISDPKVLELFEDSQHRIQSMALVHETLYQSHDLSQVNLGTYLHELADELWRSYGTRAQQVRLSFQAEEILVGIDTAIPCGLIVNELVSNALKHAFPDGRAGEVRIRLRKGTRSTYVLAVHDTGIGLPEDVDLRQAESLGLRLVTSLTEQLSGSMEVERIGGTRFTLSLSGLKHQAIRRSVDQALASRSLL
jgi:PAS domain S-box-containing protein